ncbi:MAG: helix-turn-helix transcriptional regulator [Bdellovibrionales bacterium]|nr:helix-turn-helix transcriptional regulator [Bdellovibrionales bacterium]
MAKKQSITHYSLPERLRYIRRERNMTQSDLAKKSKVSQSTIAQIESGRKDPSINTLKQIAGALNIELAILFATDDVHVFDMKKLNEKYKKVEDLHPTIHVALDRVVRYAKKIGF